MKGSAQQSLSLLLSPRPPRAKATSAPTPRLDVFYNHTRFLWICRKAAERVARKIVRNYQEKE